MVTDHPNAATWPDELAWIVSKLHRERQRGRIKFQPDVGPPITRFKDSGFNALVGTIFMDEATWQAVQAIRQNNSYNLYRVADPETKEPLLVAFVRPPEERKSTSTTVGSGPTVRTYEIDFTLRIL